MKDEQDCYPWVGSDVFTGFPWRSSWDGDFEWYLLLIILIFVFDSLTMYLFLFASAPDTDNPPPHLPYSIMTVLSWFHTVS